MQSNRKYGAVFVIVLLFVGLIGITATARNAGEVGSSTAEAESVPANEEAGEIVDTQAVDAYLAELEEKRQVDAYLSELDQKEKEKEAAARAAASAPKRTAPPSNSWVSADGEGRWDQLAVCESGGNWSYPPISGGFSGGLMFYVGTWRANGGQEFAPDAHLATREQQIIVAERVLARSGWRAWPGCSRKFGWL